MRKNSLLLILTLLTISTFAVTSKKSVPATRIEVPPKIDGVLGDAAWDDAISAKDFVQFYPYNGEKASQPSEVKIVYDDRAIYVGAMLYDSSPDSIMTELSERDEIKMSDHFGIYFNPFNDNITAYGFFVTSAGVQIDMKASISGHEDESWDAVWKSAVSITDQGWIVEYEIPYSALRFPNEKEQVWGMNIFRNIMRHRENTSWNFVDREIDGMINQAGLLTGIQNIEPPLRLSFTPYLSGYIEKQDNAKDWGSFYNYGLDLKYGINESFTLDMTLIPDFGQVQSDDEIVNLSPFEVYYDEKRPFFMEGTELFQKGNVFYSRRIGGTPTGYYDVYDDYSEEDIVSNPEQTQLINATKISGKTNRNLGIGVFNAINSNTYATVNDSTEGEKKILTEPFTNYNMLVFDQALKNNSFVSLYNTNVYRGSKGYTANVTGTEFKLATKSNMYAVGGMLNVSQKYYNGDSTNLGYAYEAWIGKISGRFTYEYEQEVKSDTYDPNDMGFLRRNNEFSHDLTLRYNIYDPFWKLLGWYNRFTVTYSSLYKPNVYTSFRVRGNSRLTFKNHFTTGFFVSATPAGNHDYFEPRVDGWMFKRAPQFFGNVFISPDYRKRLIADVRLGFWKASEYQTSGYSISVEPRFRASDKLFIVFETDIERSFNNLGYVYDSLNAAGNDIIIFGKRHINTITNTIESSYIFNNKSSLSFRLRHYWIQTQYNNFYDLLEDGSLALNDYNDDHDFSFNAFNIDMVYTWNFAPGSEMIIVWKNSIYASNSETSKHYIDNLRYTLDSPMTNSFSLKLLYYLDYQYFKKKTKAPAA